MKVLGKTSRSSLASVVFPLDEEPLMPTMTAFLVSPIVIGDMPYAVVS